MTAIKGSYEKDGRFFAQTGVNQTKKHIRYGVTVTDEVVDGSLTREGHSAVVTFKLTGLSGYTPKLQYKIVQPHKHIPTFTSPATIRSPKPVTLKSAGDGEPYQTDEIEVAAGQLLKLVSLELTKGSGKEKTTISVDLTKYQPMKPDHSKGKIITKGSVDKTMGLMNMEHVVVQEDGTILNMGVQSALPTTPVVKENKWGKVARDYVA